MVLYLKSHLIKKEILAICKGCFYLIYCRKKIFQAGVRFKLLKIRLILMHQTETYLLQEFVEVEIGITPERTQFSGKNTQDKRN